MIKFSFFKSTLFFLGSFLLLVSCDKDFNEVGGNIIGEDNYVFESATFPVTTYNQFSSAVQSNNLPVNQLGVIDNGFFGTTTSSFVTQVQLAVLNPEFPSTTVVDKVELVVPYFSTPVEGSTNLYTLDSIYGRGKINLQIYESNKFLKNIDPFTLEAQRYYSDEFTTFNASIAGIKLNNSSDVSENTEFKFSDLEQEELTIAEGVEKTTKVAPRMRLQLDKMYFENMLKVGKTSGKLASNSLFQQYFRGLFFKVESVGSEKSMALLNFAAGKITVYYKESSATEQKRKTLVLNMASNTVNLFQNQYNTVLPTHTVPTVATTNLFVKGGSGYHSYIDLFGTADEKGIIPKAAVAALKANNWIINEANLVFTVDKSNAIGTLPERLYLYNVKSQRPIIDYFTDGSGQSTKPKLSKNVYGGIISENANGTVKYKLKITNHLRNIVQNDSLNVRLGLSVTEDITKIGNRFIKNVATDVYYNRLPEASVINPLGAILFGSDSSIDESKRVKLEIFYTKPN